jgi:predicted CXXCH cytochrome family protein
MGAGPGRRRQIPAGRGALAAIVLAAALAGCSGESRYRTLSFFFDGVPPPPGSKPAETASGQSAAESSKVAYVKHAPYAKRQCDGCHVPSTNNLIAQPPALCLRCHKMELEKKRHVHAPALAGFCRLCHDPHGSRHPALLNAAPREMCLYCHNAEDIAKNPTHAREPEAPCTQCHNPHADNRYFLREAVPAAGETAP